MRFLEFKRFIMRQDNLIHMDDGIYDTTGIEFLIADQNNPDEVTEWLKDKDRFWLASAYQTEYYILYAAEPPKFIGNRFGNGFNYGSTNMLTECPESILILAEDD